MEGGGTLHGTYLTFHTENVTVDAGGIITSEGLGYQAHHTHAIHGSSSVHGHVNPGRPDEAAGVGSGGGHGGSGGHGSKNNPRSGFAYGNIFEPNKLGSAGGYGGSGKTSPGGTGGGHIWMNVTKTIEIDGEVSAKGGNADSNGGGGGAGGSIWMFCNIIKGFGKITSHGGQGSSKTNNPGGGGAGGRIGIYFKVNLTMMSFSYEAHGGPAGGSAAENGGAGTVFIYHLIEDHTTLLIDNGGLQPKDKYNVIADYNDLSTDSCRTWILPESSKHFFAGGGNIYHFDEFHIKGGAHLAFLTDPVGEDMDIFFRYMIGNKKMYF